MRIAQALILACTAVIPVGAAWAGAEMAFDSAPVSDAELAGNYGKFIAPGGIDLAMSVQSDTAVDGQLVLRSVFTVDQGPARIQVYAPAPGTQGPSYQGNATVGQAQSGAGNPGLSVTVDRMGANTSVQPTFGAGSQAPNVAVTTGGQSVAATAAGNDGLVPVIATAGGGAVPTGAGAVSISSTSTGTRITLDALGLSISHLVGGATGTVVANTGNNRTIDTVTSMSIDVRNGDSLAIASSLMQVSGIATAATQAMVR